jgi:HEAT repeat protein
VPRVLTIALFAAISSAPLGCAGTMDAITSRKFRKEPFTTTYHLWHPEDPMVILRANPPREGDERARAMHRLKEPLANKLTQQDQDEIVDLLARTATKDASPVLRLAAIDALGRFQDSRSPGILMIAYQKAHGRPDGTPDPLEKPESGIQLAGARSRTPKSSLVPLTGPVGYSPETVEAIRCQALESLGRTNRPEAVQFLAAVAAGSSRQSAPEGADDREVRLAAVRGLTKCRQPESVAALAQVLADEKKGKDTALIGRAHDGLVNLTGKRLPPDPEKWNEVVQAGVKIAPEPNWVQNAIEWVKK